MVLMQGGDDDGMQHLTCMKTRVPQIYDSSQAILGLFHELIMTIKRPTDDGYFSDEYTMAIDHLERRIGDVVTASDTASSTSDKPYDLGIEMYQIMVLIYLERASRNFSGQSDKITSLVERGFKIMEQLDTSNGPLPLFILGLEARTDQQRMFILDTIERSAALSRLRSLETVGRLLQAAWIQDDLDTQNDVDYVLKLDTLITSNPIMPTLA
ncbi:putative Fungal-specific transcription factor domain-containing protein [Seiridium cardinale]|uniref:Fungal-specific transcription factor domain-containing protein n=1 Tax=Seiridium cardinale TaxID=138064 RepID=A0ABR2XVC2_9PEZI